MDITQALNGAYVNSFRSWLAVCSQAISGGDEEEIDRGITLWTKFITQSEDGTKKHVSAFYWKYRDVFLTSNCEEIFKREGDKIVLCYNDKTEEYQALTKKQKAAVQETKLFVSHIYSQAAIESSSVASSSDAPCTLADRFLMHMYRLLYLVCPLLDSGRIKEIMCRHEEKCKEVSLAVSLQQASGTRETTSDGFEGLKSLNIQQLIGKASGFIQGMMSGDPSTGNEMLETIKKNVDPDTQQLLTKSLDDLKGQSMNDIVGNVTAMIGGIARNVSAPKETTTESVVLHSE